MSDLFFGIIVILVLGFSSYGFYAMCKASDDESDRILGRGKYKTVTVTSEEENENG